MKLNKKRSFRLLINICLITVSNIVTGQDIILKIKKGSIQLNKKSISSTNPSFTLSKTDVVNIPIGALVLANINDKYLEIPSGNTYQSEDIQSLNKKKSSSNKGKSKAGIVNTLFVQSIQHTDKNAGISTRASDREPDFYAPLDVLDTLIIISDTAILEFGNQSTTVETNFVVKKIENSKIYYDDKPTNNKITLINLPAGMYSWKGTIKSLNQEISYNNVFVVKDESFEKDFSKKINDFKKYLDQETDYSDDMKQILIKDFYASEKVYLKE
jgi:hypothetical protein